jgi:DNA-binding NarL/FixJ family response regulator
LDPARATPIAVLVVDDDPRVREGLRALLALDPRLQVVGEGASLAEALARAAAAPDVVLLDLELAAEQGFAPLGRLRAAGVPAIALAVYPDREVEALAMGASACLLKDAPRQQLVATILQVARRHGQP